MKRLRFSAAFAAATALAGAGATGTATEALADAPIVTKAPAAPASCSSLWDFVVTNCPLTWYGITIYGTLDIGGGYQTHGAPFDPNFVTGASYFLQKMNRVAMWGLAPSGLSQSSIGVKGYEPFAPGWAFVFALEAGFDPYSLQLANSPRSESSNIGVPITLQTTNGDSSRAGQFYNALGFLGVSSPTYGTLTVFRQNSLGTDGVIAYDPMGGSYAFSPIGFSGTVAGGGDTENARYSTSLKYRVNIGDFRLAALWQFGGYQLNNGSNGAVEGGVGGDAKFIGPGILSLDAIAGWNKDAVNLGLSGGGVNASGMPVAPFPGQIMTATISNNTNVMALAKYSFNAIPLRLYGGYEWMQFAPPSDPQTSFTDIAGFAVTGFAASTASPNGTTAINNVAYTAACGTGICSDKILQAMWTGAKYGVTKDVDLVGAYYHYIQNTYTTASCANSGAHSQCNGTMDAFSFVVDWRFLPKWDTYIGTFFSQMNGGLDNGYLARNNLATTAGVRFRF